MNISIGVSWAKRIFSVTANIIANFRARVYADNGIFEAGPCLNTTLAELNDIGLLANSSLVVTPNAYKESILYSVVPSDGSGDMNVVRATTATRVNSAGLIEVVPRNLLGYSEEFNNAYWVKVGSTISTNATTAPNGTTTADKLIEDTSNGNHSGARFGAMASAGTYTLSIYAKVGERTSIAIGNASAGHFAIFDLSLGTVVQGSQGTVTNGAISSIDSNGYYRISCNITITSLSSISVNLVSTGTTTSYTGDGTSGIFIWGAQLEAGSTATEYFPTTTRLNIPRIDYTNGSCPSILVEGQRTNRALYSNTFDNAYWIKTNVTLSSTSGGIINGGNYYTVTCDGTTGTFKGIGKGFLNDSANTYSLSVFAKAGTSSTFIVSSRNFLTSNSVFASFNLSNGTINSQDGGTASIVNYGNGWYRCTFVVVNAGTYTNQASIFFGHPINAADGLTLLVSGAQAEAGSYATSYIPTVASAVTRNADFLTRAGFGNTSTSGTLLFDLYAENISSSAGEYILQLFAGAIITDTFFSTANSISIIANGTSIQIFNNGFTQLVQSITPTQGQRVKIAIRYNGTNISSSINGTVSSVLTDTSVGVKNAIRINNGQFSTHAFNSVVFIPEYLTDEQLILLTGDSYASYAEMANALNYTIQ